MTVRAAFEAAAHRSGEAHNGLIFWDDVFNDDEVGDALADFLVMGATAGRVAERARIAALVRGLPADWRQHPVMRETVRVAWVDRAAVLAAIGADR